MGMRSRSSSRPRAWSVLAAVLACFAQPCAAETLHPDSKIVAVTVFPDRAGVMREARLELPPGSSLVEIGPLPSQVEPDSVSAKGVGEGGVTLYGARLITRQLATAQDSRVKALEEEIRKAMRRDQELRDTQKIVEQERAYLASIQAASSEQIGKDLVTKAPSATDAAALLAFLDDAFTKNAQRAQQASVELEELSRQLDKLRRELAELTRGGNQQESLVQVELEAKKAGTFQLQVSYRLPGASWQPTYEARATATANEVELVLSGVVRQRTGEDWPEAQVSLSTARPSVAGSMPELEPWFLRPWEPPVAALQSTRLLRAMAPEAVDDQAMMMDENGAPRRKALEREEAKVAYATVEAEGPSVTFQLAKPTSIPSDWQAHKAPIVSQRLAAALAYQTTPRLLPLAFLRAKVTNSTEALLLAGPVSVFLDGAFVATAAMPQVAPGETFDLYLGVDERVKIERKQLKEHVEVSLLPGLRGKTKSTEYEFLTTIENFTGRRITVTAFDQVPVSEREEIVVESVKTVPVEIEKDKEKPGVFHWALDLSPTQKQELRLSYRVRHPVDLRIQ